MIKAKDIIKEIETIAPLQLQDGFDNAGLQIGNIQSDVTGVLLCLDITEEVIDEALELECNLIISHHPLIFKPLKSITGKTYIERCVQKACKHDLIIYSAHTNLDNAWGGVNFRIAEKLGLQNIRIVSPKKESLLKLVTFVPHDHAAHVRNALFQAGAGNIGNYDSCSFNTEGEGSFCGNADTHPFAGEPEKFRIEPEIRIETILPVHKKSAVLRALLTSHPYEEPAYDFYLLQNAWEQAGAGAIGELPASEDEVSFLHKIKTVFHTETLKHSRLRGKEIRTVAVCGGSGAFLLPEAIACGADAFITGEAKYNDFYDVENLILLAVAGHYETEICTKELFFEIITKKFPTFAVHFSNANDNPVNYI